MGDRTSKDALYEGLVAPAKALASGRRAEIVDLLAQGERSVEAIAEEIGQSVANTSQHLQHLLRVGLVRTRRDGTRIFYSLAGDEVAELWSALQKVAARHHGAIDRLATAYLGDRSKLDVMTRDVLRQRLRRRDVVVLDVRPAPEYDAGHIAGAVCVPIAELQRRLRELPAGTDIVAYCRGAYCVYADDAVRALRRRGFNAVRLQDGYPEWARARLPVETSDDSTM